MRYLTNDNEYTIYYYYTAYDILIGDRLINEYREYNRHVIEDSTKELKALNDIIVNNHKEGYINRNGLAWDRLLNDIDSVSKSDGYRLVSDYVSNGYKLIDYTIKKWIEWEYIRMLS